MENSFDYNWLTHSFSNVEANNQRIRSSDPDISGELHAFLTENLETFTNTPIIDPGISEAEDSVGLTVPTPIGTDKTSPEPLVDDDDDAEASDTTLFGSPPPDDKSGPNSPAPHSSEAKPETLSPTPQFTLELPSQGSTWQPPGVRTASQPSSRPEASLAVSRPQRPMPQVVNQAVFSLPSQGSTWQPPKTANQPISIGGATLPSTSLPVPLRPANQPLSTGGATLPSTSPPVPLRPANQPLPIGGATLPSTTPPVPLWPATPQPVNQAVLSSIQQWAQLVRPGTPAHSAGWSPQPAPWQRTQTPHTPVQQLAGTPPITTPKSFRTTQPYVSR